MRKLMWISIGFACGCFLCAYLLWNWLFLFAGGVCLLSAVVLLFFNKKPLKVVSFVLFGFCLSVLWFWAYDSFYWGPTREYNDEKLSASIQVADYSFETDYGIAFDGRIRLEKKNYKIRVYLNEVAELKPGDVVAGDFHILATTADNEKDFKYHQGNGILMFAYEEGNVNLTIADKVPAKYFAAKLRKDISDMLQTVFPEDTAAFACALLLGDSSDLSYEEDTAYKVSGIRHIIAVSGLHVSILFSLLHLLAAKRRLSTAIIAIPVLVVFAAVAGFSPSVIRACVMQILIIIADLFNREYDPPTALSFSALIMLIVNPLTVTSVSFQLSLGCMVGIFAFSRPITNYIRRVLRDPGNKSLRSRLTRGVAGGTAVTLSAMTVTTPLSAWYFGTVSVGSVFTNLLTLWAVSFIFYGIMLSAAIGFIWLPLGKVIAWCISWLIRYVQIVSKGISEIPGAAVYTCSVYIVLWLAFVYILIAAFILIKKKKPVVFAAVLIVSLVMSIGASWLEPRLSDLQVTVFDVGQGQSILLQWKNHRYLVDCGGDTDEIAANTVSQKLLSQGIHRLDGVILTHYDTDHAGGVMYLLGRIKTDAIYLPDVSDDGEIREQITREYNDRIYWVNDASILDFSGAKLTMIPGQDDKDENESGLCILFQAKDCDILITGDRNRTGELQLLEEMKLPQVELLVVGHHGSMSSTSFEFLSTVQPQCAVISVGEDNNFGHPSEDVIDRLKMFGCKIFRTDTDGTVVFRR